MPPEIFHTLKKQAVYLDHWETMFFLKLTVSWKYVLVTVTLRKFLVCVTLACLKTTLDVFFHKQHQITVNDQSTCLKKVKRSINIIVHNKLVWNRVNQVTLSKQVAFDLSIKNERNSPTGCQTKRDHVFHFKQKAGMNDKETYIFHSHSVCKVVHYGCHTGKCQNWDQCKR